MCLRNSRIEVAHPRQASHDPLEGATLADRLSRIGGVLEACLPDRLFGMPAAWAFPMDRKA